MFVMFSAMHLTIIHSFNRVWCWMLMLSVFFFGGSYWHKRLFLSLMSVLFGFGVPQLPLWYLFWFWVRVKMVCDKKNTLDNLTPYTATTLVAGCCCSE